MRRIIDGLITAFAIIFFIPSALILVSWNAIPGDSLYPIKTGLEDVSLTLLSGTPLVSKASIKYTDRRLVEAGRLLDKKGSSVGYDLLVAEAKQTEHYITLKNDSQSASEFSQNIDEYKQQIEEKRAEIVSTQNSESLTQKTTAVPTGTSKSTDASAQMTLPPQAGPSAQPQTIVIDAPQVVVIQEEDSQSVIQKLDEVKEELEDIQKNIDEKSKKNSGGKENGNDKSKGNGKSDD